MPFDSDARIYTYWHFSPSRDGNIISIYTINRYIGSCHKIAHTFRVLWVILCVQYLVYIKLRVGTTSKSNIQIAARKVSKQMNMNAATNQQTLPMSGVFRIISFFALLINSVYTGTYTLGKHSHAN